MMSMVETARKPVFSLSIHADYRCRQSGVCCTSGWDVPVEVPLYRSLDEALSSGRIAPSGIPDEADPPLIVEQDLPDEAAAMVARTASSAVDRNALLFSGGGTYSRLLRGARFHISTVITG